MERSELRPCGVCGKGLCHTGMPLFYKVTVQRYGIDARRVREMAGLEMFFGGGSAGAVLADVMGPHSDIAFPITAVSEILVCEDCSTGKAHLIAGLSGLGREKKHRYKEREKGQCESCGQELDAEVHQL